MLPIVPVPVEIHEKDKFQVPTWCVLANLKDQEASNAWEFPEPHNAEVSTSMLFSTSCEDARREGLVDLAKARIFAPVLTLMCSVSL